MKEVLLKQREVRTIVLDGEEYFYVEDIKSNCPELKIETLKIKYHEEIPLIMVEYIHMKTDFDNMITKVWNHKPKKDI
ncbi:hypothetical protein [Chryseobacterium indologenes]|uniref:hypothetical protein n=1 Tax=Chryseobacterium indologenes TaxID=253 RepID=UPI003D33EFDD